VPWKAYLPEARAGQAPVIIFSHGLGGSRDGSESMGRHLASHGYAVFHSQHAGTDRAAFQRLGAEGIMASLRDDPQIILDRFRDVPFALDEVTKLSRSELRGRIDPARAGISGHSFGAITTLTIAGQRAQRRIIGQRFADPRFTAALAMSPNKPAQGSAQEAFADMKMPIFHMTGTKDGSPVNPNMSPSDRLIPFATINNVGQHLLLLNGGTHFTFADVDEFQSRSLAYPGLDRHKALIRAGSLAYWDAYLKGNASAKSWLVNGGYARYAGDQARVDYKPARR
jgi:predicted dienelactone hydrolase